jgi:DNA-binding response OmpR family regulator
MKKRLDEILIARGLITERAIREALMRQKAYGGRFGSMLLYYRYIDEKTLVDALTAQLGCEGVVISGIDVSQDVVKMVPAKIALARHVMPFEYLPDQNVLKVACVDPTDHTLMKELSFVAHGKEIKAYVAAEMALSTAIAKYYLGQKRSLDDNLLLEIPDDATMLSDTGEAGEVVNPREEHEAGSRVLLVTDEGYSGPLVESILERDNHAVTVTDSQDKAVGLLRDGKFDTMLIKAGLCRECDDLAARVRALSHGTAVLSYESASALILDGALRREGHLVVESLNLFTSLLSSMAKLPGNHSGRVGRQAYRLCSRLGLPDADRLVISVAAHVHDVARYYYGLHESKDTREIIDLTARLLASVNFNPAVLEVLRAAYTDLDRKDPERLSIGVLGGNIITVVDLYCHAIPADQVLSMDNLDAVKRKLTDLVDKILLRDVVEAFVEMIQEDVLEMPLGHRGLQVMVYAEDAAMGRPVELRLANEGFRTVFESAPASLVELCKRSEPDILVLVVPGKSDAAISLIEYLNGEGLDTSKLPTFVVAEAGAVPGLTGLLGLGIEDVVVLEQNPDVLVQKVSKAAKAARERAGAQHDSSAPGAGTSGRLADMNLIDLIQALGLGRKTVKITVQGDADQGGTLTIFLKEGYLVFASLRNLTGADAVYEGMTWGGGVWNVEPASPDDIPEANNDQPNEAILMEGCRLLDERIKAGHLL